MIIEMAEVKKKRMLEMDPVGDGRMNVRINSSSLDVIQTCKRKAHYALARGARREDEGEALIFGKAIHKALQVFYSTIPGRRDEKVLEAARHAFRLAMVNLAHLDGEARSVENGIKILDKYFETYSEDQWVVYVDEDGPFVERDFEFKLCETSSEIIWLHGTIDLVLKNLQTGEICPVDHKTTSRLGQEFYNKMKPNHQFTGYMMAAHYVYGIDAENFMVNGIQVAKTKCDLVRAVTQRSAEDFLEFIDTIMSAVSDYLKCMQTGIWPLGPASACSMWSGCQFRSICESQPNQREFLLRSLYPEAKVVTT